ncbi:MAG: DNA methyltransferase [Anaerovoracaceae bacterium]
MTQIKTKKRVADHGEVFTSDREVNAMLDLVKDETERIDSRFLEPACGSGQFLSEILSRKMQALEKYKKSRLEYQRYAFVAVSSMYGIEILEDNLADCIERLHKEFSEKYKKIFKTESDENFLEVIHYVFTKNIVLGDALTMKNPKTDEDIVFPEWSIVTGDKVKRKDFAFGNLIETADTDQFSIFTDVEYNSDGIAEIIPKPVREYPMTHYLKVVENGNTDL